LVVRPPDTIVLPAPAPVIVRLFPTVSGPLVSVIVPAGTMMVEPAGALAISLRSVPGLPSSARLVTVTVSALAAPGAIASVARTAAMRPRRLGYEM
jgi:hypothetical protein